MAPAAAAVAVLSNDLLREILILLPSPADLLRTALACKPFLRAARNAAFLRRFRRLHPSSCPLLLGCLLLHPRHQTPLLIPTAAPRVAQVGDFSLSFLPRGGWLGAPWQFLDCRNGLLLLKNWGSQELTVADPLTRRCISLPAPPAGRPIGYGLVADDGDSSMFRVVCISRDGGSSRLRALLLSSGEISWADVAGLSCEPSLAGSRAMQANRSLYWTLEGGERMLALNTATTEFSVLELPPFLRQLSFDVIEKGEDGGGLHLLTMRGFCIEVWAGAEDGAGGLTWTRVEKSVRFHKVMERMHDSVELYRHGLDVIGVVAGVVFLRQWDRVLSIDLETMKLRRLSEEDCSSALIYPYTMAWPPSFLNPTGQGA